MNKKTIVLAVAILGILGYLGLKNNSQINLPNFSLSSISKSVKGETILNPEEAKNKVVDYIVKNLVKEGTKVEMKNISEENGIYKLELNISDQEVVSYMTKDGEKFFVSAMDMSKELKTASDNESASAEITEAPKSDKPVVELFVMSYCPYGTQIEKGILPVVKTLGNKIDFQLKFVDYAMHDKKELDENLFQYCLQKNQPEKLMAYLECFLKKGQGTEEACIVQAKVEKEKISNCVNETDKEFKVTESYKDKSAWKGGNFPPFDVEKADNEKYKVQGSPTLVINEAVISSGRDAMSLLKTICSAFNNSPAECQTELSAESPSPGFGEGTVANSNDADCGD